MLIVILIAFLLIEVHAADKFSGFRVSLTEKHLIELSKDLIRKILKESKIIKEDPMITTNRIAFSNFTLKTKNIRAEPELLFKGAKASLMNGTFELKFEETFRLKFTFNYEVRVSRTHIDSGKGQVFILAKNTKLLQNYTLLNPSSEMKGDLVLESVIVNKGIYSESVSGAISAQFKEVIKNIKVELDKYLKEAYILGEYEYFNTTLKSQNIVIFIRAELIQSTQDNETKHQVRLTKANTILNGNIMNSEAECTYDRQLNENKSELCFCKHLFLWPVMKDGYGHEVSVNLSDWGLKGKIQELYEIMPEIVHLFSPNTTYEVVKTPVDILIEKGDVHRLYMIMNYTFNTPLARILELSVMFNIELEGHYDKEKEVLNVIQKNVEIKKIDTNGQLTISADIRLIRYLEREAELVKGQKLIPEGLKIPFKDPTVAESNDKFCVQA